MKQTLHSDTLHALNASPDTPEKGLQAYFTPPAWARALSTLLPHDRVHICDFTAGDGSLLSGAVNKTTKHLYGIEIDPTLRPSLNRIQPSQLSKGKAPLIHHLEADVTELFDILDDVDFRPDLFVLNPPFSLRWHHDRFAALRNAAHGDDQYINSTLATLRMANHLMPPKGEAMIITNANAFPSLIKDLQYCWAAVRAPIRYAGVSPTDRSGRPNDVIVLYLAKAYDDGLPDVFDLSDDLATARIQLESLRQHRKRKFTPRWGRPNADTRAIFDAAAEEWKIRQDLIRPTHNITLADNGTIKVHFRSYQRFSTRIDSAHAKQLRKLQGSHPLSLVLQKATRSALQLTISSGIWSCSPKAKASINDALQKYNQERAPLRPLGPVQRLGFLDEHDRIKCTQNLQSALGSQIAFKAGHYYEVTTEIFEYQSNEERPRIVDNELDHEVVRVAGCDLLITIHRNDGAEFNFLHNPDRAQTLDHRHGITMHNISNLHPLSVLIDHFEIPEVPDVAQTRPEEYQEALDRLEALNL